MIFASYHTKVFVFNLFSDVENVPVFYLQMWKGRGDPVLHIELRRWADVFVIAPLDANTLGKLAYGLCDNLLVIMWTLS